MKHYERHQKNRITGEALKISMNSGTALRTAHCNDHLSKGEMFSSEYKTKPVEHVKNEKKTILSAIFFYHF